MEVGGTDPVFENRGDLVRHRELNKMHSRWQEDREGGGRGHFQGYGEVAAKFTPPVCLSPMAESAMRLCACCTDAPSARTGRGKHKRRTFGLIRQDIFGDDEQILNYFEGLTPKAATQRCFRKGNRDAAPGDRWRECKSECDEGGGGIKHEPNAQIAQRSRLTEWKSRTPTAVKMRKPLQNE